MTKQIAIVVSLLAITSTLYAADSRTATKFLRAYVDTLCAEKSGDHAKALETITPLWRCVDSGVMGARHKYVGGATNAIRGRQT